MGVRDLVEYQRGAPFPLQVNYKQVRPETQSVSTKYEHGAPVEVIAGGWSFHVLTTTGVILFWGTLDADMFDFREELSNPNCRVQSPRVLARASADPVKSIAGGRKHAVALTSNQAILEWHTWEVAVQHESMLELRDGDAYMSIVQLEAGWDFTVALLHPAIDRQTSPSKHSGNQHTTPSTSRLIYWHSTWVTEQQDVDGIPTWTGVRRVVLPSLPQPLPHVTEEIDTVLPEDHTTITQIAGGEDYVIALTKSGLVYKLDVSPPPQIGVEAETGFSHTATLLSNVSHRGERRWKFMEHFCLPSRLAQLSSFQQDSRLKDLVSPALRIAHISAQFRTWAAYTAADMPPKSHQGPQVPTESKGGIVLLGKGDSEEETGPTVKPELQGIGVIKVSVGDWHCGALTASGQVLTWGQWSHGALGTWDTLPIAPGRTSMNPDHGLPPLLRHRGIRLGLAAARGRARGGQITAQPTPHQQPRERDQATLTTPTENSGSPAEAASTPVDPWHERLKERIIPSQGTDTPTRVHFDAAKRGTDFAFAIAFAGECLERGEMRDMGF